MEARLKTSQKWIAFPQDICQVITRSVSEEFPEQQEKGQFIAEGWIYPEEMILRLGYLESGRLTQKNFEISLDFDAKKQNALEQIQRLSESGVSLMGQLFQNPEEDLPYEWKLCNISGEEVYMRYSTVNSSLEEEADRLLGQFDDGLVGQTEQSELEELYQKLGLNSEKKEPFDFQDDAEKTTH